MHVQLLVHCFKNINKFELVLTIIQMFLILKYTVDFNSLKENFQ